MSGYTTDLAWRPRALHRRRRRARACSPSSRPARRSSSRASTTPGCRSPATAAQLEAFLGHPAQANAYYTPRGSQGLPVHHDTHEVISLQVAGEKRWLVYEPVLELPLKNQRYRSELGAPGEPVLDVTLRAGDTIYLPRGWLHQALTSELRLAAHHRRRQRAPLDRRSARGARRCRTRRARLPGDDRRRRAARAARARRRTRSGVAPASASFAAGGRSWTDSCPSCARSTSSRSRPSSSGETP